MNTFFLKKYKFLILFISILILSPMIAQAYSQEDYLELNKGWKYRFGDSPLTSSGTFSWISDDISNKDWKDITIKSPCLTRDKNYNCVWYSIILPEFKCPETDIYFPYIAADSIDIFLGENLIYSYKASRFDLVDTSINFQRILISLPNDFPGKKLSLRINSNYNNVGPSVSVYIGSHFALLKQNISNDLDNLVLGFLFLLLGIIMIPVIIFLKKNERKSFVTLLIFTSSLGIWMLEQYFELDQIIHLSRTIMHFIFNLSLFVFMIFILYFFEQLFEGLYNISIKIVKVYHIIFLFVFIIMFAVNINCGGRLNNIIDYMLNLPFYFSGTAALIVLIWAIIANIFKGDTDSKILMFGFAIFGVFAILDAILIGMKIGYYKPIFTKWSLLVFVSTLVIIAGRRFFEAHRKLVDYSNELESKNESLNQMWIQLKASKDEVDTLNITLENRVQERTEELEATLDTLLETQSQLIQSEKMAALGGLVAGISHEINTPVGIGVTAASHLDKESKEISELYSKNKMKKSDFENYLKLCTESTGMILTNLKRASELIKSFKKVAVDQSNEQKRIFKLKEYLDEVLLSLSPSIKNTNTTVSLTCNEEIELNSYPGAFSQIVTNLVFNSISHAFNPEDSGNLKIEVLKKDNTIFFTYSDDGKGIPKENIEKIYEPFFTTKRNKGGTGLGLNVIYNLVTKTLNGKITCESELGKCTAFKIIFPIQN